MEIKHIISEIKTKMDAAGGLKAVYFIACGGSQAAIYPGKYLLDHEAKNIGTKIYNSDEFLHAMPKSLDARCVCIICSLKGTRETVDAVRAANEKGAVTIAMTGFPNTPMAKNGQYVVVYSNGDDQLYSDSNQANVLRIGFEILHQFEAYPYYDQAIEAYEHIDKIIAKAKKDMLPAALDFAEKFKEDEIFYVLGSGSLYGTAYTMTSCHFMEMQGRHAVLMHSGEYFHGPFETTDQKVAMVLLMGSGATRALDERALRFIKKYAGHYIIIDVKETAIRSIDAHVAEFFDSVLMIPIERFFVAQLAEIRGKSMDERRYMWKVEY